MSESPSQTPTAADWIRLNSADHDQLQGIFRGPDALHVWRAGPGLWHWTVSYGIGTGTCHYGEAPTAARARRDALATYAEAYA